MSAPKKPKSTRQACLGRERIDLAEIDRILAVAPRRYPKVAERLAKFVQERDSDIDVAGFREQRLVAMRASDTPVLTDLNGSVYQMELRRIPPMDRDEESRMARRYEFLCLRVQCELVQLGIATEAAKALALQPRTVVMLAVQAAAPAGADTGYLVRCLEQLELLRNLYVESALHIVLGTVAHYRGLGVDTQDLIQEGNAALFQAIDGFDWRRDVRFRTYAQYWVQQAVLKMLYNSSRTVRVPIWVQKLLGRIRRVQDAARRTGVELTREEIARQLGITAERVAQVLDSKRYAVSLDTNSASGDDGATIGQLLADESQPPVPDLVREGNLTETLQLAMQDLPDRERRILSRRFGLDGREPATLGEIAVELGITAERVRQLQNTALMRLQRPAKLKQLRSFVEFS